MPVYEYRCGICKTKMEERYENSDSAPKTIDCMICGYPAGRIFSSFNIGSKADLDMPDDCIGTAEADYYIMRGHMGMCPHGYPKIIVDKLEKQGTVTVPLKDPLKIRMN
jgi:putative FmdB family regulatory protein